MLNWARTIMHVDYDAFFASVEQQANPFLRGKAIGITGSSLTRGVVCAASREAKKFGIKTGMPLFKARELCPHILPIKGDFTKYLYIHKKTLEIFEHYTNQIEPFSIDEAFLDITQTVKFFGTAENVANKIKQEILQNFGDYITCSIGIGPNKLLAKLVSEFNKPNGLFTVTPQNIDFVLAKAKLTDFCGIGKRINTRLENLKITTVLDLQKTPIEILKKEFGTAEATFLKNLSFGIGDEIVCTIDYTRPVKSISHQHTLAKNTKNTDIIKSNLKRLTEMVGKRLRAKNMVAKTIFVSLRDAQRNHCAQRYTLTYHTDTTQALYETAEKLFNSFNWDKETRFVGFGVSNLLAKTQTTLPLLQQDRTKQVISTIQDKINDKWGEFSIITAKTLIADKTKGKISSFLKH